MQTPDASEPHADRPDDAGQPALDTLLRRSAFGFVFQDGQLLPELTPRRIDELVADGTISGGMLPKIAGALDDLYAAAADVPDAGP